MEEEFEPVEGIRQLARNVVYYTKEMHKKAQEVARMTIEHDRQLTEHNVVISQQRYDIYDLHSAMRQLQYEQKELKARIALLEKQQKGEVVPKCSEQNPSPSQA